MNKIHFFVFAVIFLCVLEHVMCNGVEEFFKKVPGEVKNFFVNTWDEIKKAFSKPPWKVRRYRRRGKKKPKKTTTTTTSTTTTELALIESSTSKPHFIKKVLLPVLTTAEWRGLHEWTQMQIPHFVLKGATDFNGRRQQLAKWVVHNSLPLREQNYNEVETTTEPPANENFDKFDYRRPTIIDIVIPTTTP